MHGATIKIVNAQQARLNNIYKNTKLKLLKVNAAIWFNKICKERQLKPKYISLKINGRKQEDIRTTTHAIKTPRACACFIVILARTTSAP